MGSRVHHTRRAIALAFIFAFVAALPAPAEAGWFSRALNLDRLKNTGIILTVGVDYGALVVGGAADVGFVLKPKEAGKRRVAAGFTSATGFVGGFGYAATLATRRDLTGIERLIPFVGKDHPVYGDRVMIPFGLFGIAASRKGGLGISISMLPLPFVGTGWFKYPMLRGAINLYITNPKLMKPANWVLDRYERGSAWAKKKFAPVKATWRRMTRPIAARFGRARK